MLTSKLAAPGTLLLGVLALCACTPEVDNTATDAVPENATPLDLSRSHLPGGDSGTVELADDQELLPDFFNGEGDDNRVNVSGSLITDEAGTTLRDRVDGAEVKIEVKTP